MRIRTLRLVGLIGFAVLLTVPRVGFAARKPVAARKPSILRTYRFTARITKNGGVTPFKIGATIAGIFTYDLNAKDRRKGNGDAAWFHSRHQKLEFRCGKLRFSSTGKVGFSVGSTFDVVEAYGVGPKDVNMPAGWKFGPLPTGQQYTSRHFTLILQNAPPDDVIKQLSRPPRSITLSDFTTREFRLHFAPSVVFPGGATEKASVTSQVRLFRIPRT